MFARPLRSILALYALGIGLFIYFLGFVGAPKSDAESDLAKIAAAVNDAVLARRDDLLTRSMSRKILLGRQFEIQRQVFRQQAAGSVVTFSVPVAHTTPPQTGAIGGSLTPIITESAPTQAVIPAPIYVKPRTTVS